MSASDPPASGPRRTMSGRMSFGGERPLPDLSDARVRLRYELYWRDRERLDALPAREVFRRPLVHGEFADDFEVGGATEVEVWRGGRARGSGSVRHRHPVDPAAAWIVSDAEDVVNPFFRLGPPPGGPAPS